MAGSKEGIGCLARADETDTKHPDDLIDMIFIVKDGQRKCTEYRLL